MQNTIAPRKEYSLVEIVNFLSALYIDVEIFEALLCNSRTQGQRHQGLTKIDTSFSGYMFYYVVPWLTEFEYAAVTT